MLKDMINTVDNLEDKSNNTKQNSNGNQTSISTSTKEIQKLTASLRKQKRKSRHSFFDGQNARRRSLFKNRRLTIDANIRPQRVAMHEQQNDDDSLFLGGNKDDDTLEIKFQQEKLELELQQLQKLQHQQLNETNSNGNDKENISDELVLKIHNSKGEEEDDTINLAYNSNSRPLPPVKHQSFLTSQRMEEKIVADDNTGDKQQSESNTSFQSSVDSLSKIESPKSTRNSASGSSIDNLFKGLLEGTNHTDDDPEDNDLLVTPNTSEQKLSSHHSVDLNQLKEDPCLPEESGVSNIPASVPTQSSEGTTDTTLDASGNSIDSLFKGLITSNESGESLSSANAGIHSPSKNNHTHSKITVSSPSTSKIIQKKIMDTDSPAKNTRSRSKQKSTTPISLTKKGTTNAQHLDSPAKNTRSAVKKRPTAPVLLRGTMESKNASESPSLNNSDLSFLSMQSSDYSSLLTHESSSLSYEQDHSLDHAQKEDSQRRKINSRSKNSSYISSSSSSLSIDAISNSVENCNENGQSGDGLEISANTETNLEKKDELSQQTRRSVIISKAKPIAKSVLATKETHCNINDFQKSAWNRNENNAKPGQNKPLSSSPLDKKKDFAAEINNSNSENYSFMSIEESSETESVKTFKAFESFVQNGANLAIEEDEIAQTCQSNKDEKVTSNKEKNSLDPSLEHPPIFRNPSSNELQLVLSGNKNNEGEESLKLSTRDSFINTVSTLKQPISILNSDRKRRSAHANDRTEAHGQQSSSFAKRRTVAFGSPEAAEYNLGSPSMSLTPMHPKTAKAMFVIPEKNSDSERTCTTIDSCETESSQNPHDDSSTILLETNISALLQNNDSNEVNRVKTPAGGSQEMTDTFQLEKDIIQLVDENLSRSSLDENPPAGTPIQDTSSMSNSEPTVGLEEDLTSFLKHAEGALLTLGGKNEPEDQNNLNSTNTVRMSPNTSIDTTNSTSFADVMSSSVRGYESSDKNKSSKQTASDLEDVDESLECQKLDFESKVEQERASMEMGQQTFSKKSNKNEGILRRGQIHRSTRLSFEDTNNFDSIFTKDNFKLNPISFDDARSQSKTYELEGSIRDLLKSMHDNSMETAKDENYSEKKDTVGNPIQKNSKNFVETDLIATEKSYLTSNEDDVDKTDVSMPTLPLIDNESNSQGVDKNITLELEENIESLLNTVAEPPLKTKKEAKDPNEGNLNFLNTSMGSKELQKSSRRISLATPAKRSSENSDVFKSCKSSGSKSQASLASSDIDMSQNPEKKISDVSITLNGYQAKSAISSDDFNLTSKEVIRASKLWSSKKLQFSDTDIFLYACNSSAIGKDYFTTHSINFFLFAVCNEVEGKAEDSALKGEPRLQLLSEMDAEGMKRLQKIIRKDVKLRDENEPLTQLQILAKVVHDYVMCEWAIWESQVAQALNENIVTELVNINDENDAIERNNSLIQDTHDALSILSDEAVKKARRRSIDRRKVAVAIINDEIKSIESEIEEIESFLRSNSTHVSEVSSLFEELHQVKTLGEEISIIHQKVECLRTAATSAEGLHSWSLLTMNQSKIKLSFKTEMSEMQTQLIFSISKKLMNCVASIVKESQEQERIQSWNDTKKKMLHKYAFTRLTSICKSTSCVLDSANDIARMIQLFEWKLKRLDMIEKELVRLSSQYGPIFRLKVDENLNLFIFTVEFTTLCGTKKVRAAFEIGDSYPFSPMELSLELLKGEMNLDDLCRQLVNNTRPGYGYLSRACNVLSTYVSEVRYDNP